MILHMHMYLPFSRSRASTCADVLHVKYTLRDYPLLRIILIKRNARSREKLIAFSRYLDLSLIMPLFLDYLLSFYFILSRFFLLLSNQKTEDSGEDITEILFRNLYRD